VLRECTNEYMDWLLCRTIFDISFCITSLEYEISGLLCKGSSRSRWVTGERRCQRAPQTASEYRRPTLHITAQSHRSMVLVAVNVQKHKASTEAQQRNVTRIRSIGFSRDAAGAGVGAGCKESAEPFYVQRTVDQTGYASALWQPLVSLPLLPQQRSSLSHNVDSRGRRARHRSQPISLDLLALPMLPMLKGAPESQRLKSYY
jgi:hypothetical protein